MASLAFQIPVAIILLAGGLLACFLGYRLLRLVLAVYGFVAGVIVTTIFVGQLETWVAALATIGGGLAGMLVAILAYLVGVGSKVLDYHGRNTKRVRCTRVPERVTQK